MPRREFVRLTGIAALGAVFGGFPRMGWALSEPRSPLHGSDLRYIGMPVGGICAGQVYLSGDGRLWLWDVFNRIKLGVVDQQVVFRGSTLAPDGGANYVQPPEPVQPFLLAFRVAVDGVSRPLDGTGWSDVSFTGEYPIGTVEFREPTSPISVTLEAFSPFIPLDADASGLPATTLTYRIRNDSAKNKAITITAEMENPIGLHTGVHGERRKNRSQGGSRVVFSYEPATDSSIENRPDLGDMTLAFLAPRIGDRVENVGGGLKASETVAEFPNRPRSRLSRIVTLAPGEEAEVTFGLAWRFPNLILDTLGRVGNHYATRFASSAEVIDHLAAAWQGLSATTRAWRDVWYDSTLPRWFLDRVGVGIATAATMTVHRFADGRFYGWEGVGGWGGTCGHVWGYAHSIARIFPSLERDRRERVDFGSAFDSSGIVPMRGEFGMRFGYAADAQSGFILRAYREHTMSPDAGFLSRTYPRIRKALEFQMMLDGNEDGILEGQQPNTMDVPLYGPSSWLTSYYMAALRAGEEMARESGDSEFASRCRTLFDRASRKFTSTFWNGEYYIHRLNPGEHPEALRYGNGCLTDQLMGQGWAHQVGLGRIVSAYASKRALGAVFKRNFLADVGPYRDRYRSGRWYAMPGEAGMAQCTFPYGDRDAILGGSPTWAAKYFNETWSGSEYQAAGHMIAEGMVDEGMAIVRAVHDRYHPSKRNPYNEVEFSDHYARAMAVHGVYLAACGYEHHGPRGHLGFAPKIGPEDFRAAFTVAEGWGRYAQAIGTSRFSARIKMLSGRLRLRTLAFDVAENFAGKIEVSLGSTALGFSATRDGRRLLITLVVETIVSAGKELRVIVLP